MRWQILSAWFVACLLSTGHVSMAQVTTGTIQGTVSDASGAVIASSKVSVRNVETGFTRVVTTDTAGRYRVPELPLGNYAVTAESSGFQTVVRTGIELTVGRQAVLDFALQVGAVAESVTVSGEAPLIETTNATVANLVTEQQMRELPLNGRSFTDLTAIQPGAITDLGVPAGVFQGGGRIVLNGARPQQGSYLLDGTDIVSPYSNVAPVSVMNQTLGVDTVREFTVLQSNYGAQYGRAMGGIVNAVTRSGTNDIHGSLFEFLRNEKLDAKNFFDLPEDPIPPYKRNQFGGTIGGPLIKDKAFWFFSYEGLRQVFSTTDNESVLSLESRAGQITGCRQVPGGPPVTACTRDQMEIKDTVTVNPDIRPIINIQPDPAPGGLYFGTSAANGGSQEFRGTRKQPGRENYYMFRLDHRLSEKDSIFGRMVMDTSSKELPDAQFLDRSRNLHTSTNDWGSYKFLTTEWTRIISPSVLNVARFGFARNNNHQCMCIDGDETKRINAELYPNIAQQLTIIPGVRWTGPWAGIGANLPGGHNGPGNVTNGADLDDPIAFIDNTFSYFDSLRITKANHSLDFGIDVRRFQENELVTVWGHANTTFNSPIKNFLTAGVAPFCNTSGSGDCRGISSITMTASGTTSGNPGPPDAYRGWRQTYISWYAQDDFQLRSNLTLNLGVRWEKVTDPVEVNGRAATFKDILRDPIWTLLAKESLFKIRDDLKGLSPRFGFAYSPTQQTSVRGGFGIFKEMPLEYMFQLAVFYPPWADRLVFRNVVSWPNPLSAVNLLAGTRQPQNVVYDFKEPYGMQWNVGIEQQLGQTWVTKASYLGNRGLDLVAVINQVQPAVQKDSAGRTFTPPNSPSLNPALDSTRSYAPLGDSFYHALQLQLQKRFRAGLQFSGSYTWSKNISDVGIALKGGEATIGGRSGTSMSNLYDYKGFDKGRADQDVPHNFVFNYSYELPVGTGRKFANIGKIANVLLGGWQINGVFRARSGLPGGISGPGYQTNNFCRSCVVRPNLKPGGDNNPVIGDIDHWFDETQFEVVPAGFYGNVGANTLTGPKQVNMDFSIFKRLDIAESRNLQFRAEIFNIANHPNFSQPSGAVFDTNGQPVATPGRILTTNGPARQIQLALKFEF